MRISINEHSSIKISCGQNIYFDPFRIADDSHDADIIFITHEHFDHFSPEDIEKIQKPSTLFVMPESMKKHSAGNTVFLAPGQKTTVSGIDVTAVPACNPGKKFHPKDKAWLGYLVTCEDKKVYVAGDTDRTSDAENVRCDIALLPVGGTYTMTAQEAAALANIIKPRLALPTHYASIVGDKSDGRTFISLLGKDISSAEIIGGSIDV